MTERLTGTIDTKLTREAVADKLSKIGDVVKVRYHEPLGRPKISADTAAKIRELAAKGESQLKIAKALKIGQGTVNRTLRS